MIEVKECLKDTSTFYLNLLNADFKSGSARIRKDYESNFISEDLYKSLESHIKFREQLVLFRLRCRISVCKTLDDIDAICDDLSSSSDELGLTQSSIDLIYSDCENQRSIILATKKLEGYLDGFKKVP